VRSSRGGSVSNRYVCSGNPRALKVWDPDGPWAIVGPARRRGLNIVEKAIYVLRRSDYDPALYWIAVDGFDPILVKEHLLGHVLGLLFGMDVARVSGVIDGPTGQLKAWPWVNEAQLEALGILMDAYRGLN
jgi:hypothetical protein